MKNKLNNELAVCGFAAVKALAKEREQCIKRFYFAHERAASFGTLCRAMSQRKAPYNMVQDESELERLCGSVHHQGVVAMIEQPNVPLLDTQIVGMWIEKGEDALILDHVGNANNLGAIVRSAAFFGMHNIVVSCEEANMAITTSSYRVAQGGMEYVQIYSVKSIKHLLFAVAGKMERIGTDVRAAMPVSKIREKCTEKPALIILGNEERGISEDVKKSCDELVSIQSAAISSGGEPPVESLNVAQAAAVLLYECRKA